MKRSGFGPRKTPMSRGSWKSSPNTQPDWRAELRSGGIKRSSLKSKPKRVTVADGAKYLAACRGEPCFLNVLCDASDWADPRVVPCHDNRLSAGKGMGLKASHERTLPGCFVCHQWLDQGPAPRAEKFAAFDRGFARWVPVRARKMGLIEQQETEVA